MTAARVRADYEQLQQVAATFQQQVEATKQTLAAIQRNRDVLEGGDWVGQGASAFYREMDDNLLPTFQRLINALDTAASSTSQISAIMQVAESQAASVLRGAGNGGGGNVGIGSVGAGSASAGSGSGGSGSGTAAGPSSMVPAAVAALAAKVAFRVGLAKGSFAVTPADKKAANEMLSQLDPKVAALAGKSTILVKELKMLQDNKWPIKFMARPADVDAGTGSQTFFDPPVIEIYKDDGLPPKDYVQRIAHEAGIALDNPHLVKPSKDITYQAYVAADMPKALNSEAKAVFNEVAVRSELKKNGGGDIDLSAPKVNWPSYEKPYNDFQNGKISYDDAIAKVQNEYTADKDLLKVYEPALKQDWDEFQKTGNPGRW